MNTFEKKFKEIITSYDPQKVWEEWLDYCININLLTLSNQDLHFNGRENEYFELFKSFCNLMYEYVRKENTPSGVTGWSDFLGTFYETNVKTSYKASARGQYFTPLHVCDVMAELTMINKDYNNEFLMDSCCGSGRFILAGHSKEPTIIGYGIDLDSVACKMAVMNAYIHGARCTIINGNSLSGEFIQGWKVNQYLGVIPVPHIEPIQSFEEGLYYFGREPKVKSIEEYITQDDNVKKESQLTLDKFI